MSRLPEHLLSRQPLITLGAAIGCAIAIALALGAILYVASNSKNSRESTCKAVFSLRDTTVAVLEDAASKDPDPRNQDFYNRNIVKLEKVECKV